MGDDIEIEYHMQTWKYDDVVTLNIGGTIFQTSVDTLMKSNTFKEIFETIELQDKTNPIFIDRDPDLFKHILSYLRNNKYSFDNVNKNDLAEELKYYDITIPNDLMDGPKSYVSITLSNKYFSAVGLTDELLDQIFPNRKGDGKGNILILNPYATYSVVQHQRHKVNITIGNIYHVMSKHGYKIVSQQKNNDETSFICSK